MAAPTHRLHVVTRDGHTFAVGPVGLGYYQVLTGVCRPVTNAMHDGKLSMIKCVTIAPDKPDVAAPEAPAHLAAVLAECWAASTEKGTTP
jgi:hypothetical protein